MIDLTNKKFGRWEVLSFHHKNKKGLTYWLCRCDCGNLKVVRGQDLRDGVSKSCGCLHKEIIKDVCKNNFKKHGLSKTKLFSIWNGIKKKMLS